MHVDNWSGLDSSCDYLTWFEEDILGSIILVTTTGLGSAAHTLKHTLIYTHTHAHIHTH